MCARSGAREERERWGRGQGRWWSRGGAPGRRMRQQRRVPVGKEREKKKLPPTPPFQGAVPPTGSRRPGPGTRGHSSHPSGRGMCRGTGVRGPGAVCPPCLCFRAEGVRGRRGRRRRRGGGHAPPGPRPHAASRQTLTPPTPSGRESGAPGWGGTIGGSQPSQAGPARPLRGAPPLGEKKLIGLAARAPLAPRRSPFFLLPLPEFAEESTHRKPPRSPAGPPGWTWTAGWTPGLAPQGWRAAGWRASRGGRGGKGRGGGEREKQSSEQTAVCSSREGGGRPRPSPHERRADQSS